MERLLTDRQYEVLCSVCAEGRSIKETAYHLCIARETVKNHLTGIYRTLRYIGAIRADATYPKTPACVWFHTALRAYQGKD